MKLIVDNIQSDESDVELINHYWQLLPKLNKYQSFIIIYNVPPDDNIKSKLSEHVIKHQHTKYLEKKLDNISNNIKYANKELLTLKQ